MRPLLLLAVLLAAGCVAPSATTGGPADAGAVRFDALRFETEMGAFTAILYPEEAPESVAFIRRLVERGYYDGREFNRVIPGFVIQEVDRLGGATDQPEQVKGEFGTRAMFSGGALGIARGEDPDSGGSEFFVMDFAHSHLYGNYTAFGQVVEGMDVVRAIARVRTVQTPGAFVPGVPVGLHDRVAVDPAAVTRATVVSVELPAAEAARYPLVVGTTYRAEQHRATLEWPRDLAPGRVSPLTWYVYTPLDAPMPDLDPVSVVVRGPDGSERPATPARDPVDARVLRWTWAPSVAGVYNVTLANQTGVLGWADVPVGAG